MVSFRWESLKPTVLRGLATAAGLEPRNAAEGLGRKFGAIPSAEFVQQLWPALRDEWLERDRASATELARNLRARGVGNTSLRITNHETRLAYLRSCRVSKAVREEALKVFLAAGGGTGPEPSAGSAPPPTARGRRVPGVPNEEQNEALRRLRPTEVPGLALGLLAVASTVVGREAPADEVNPLVRPLLAFLMLGGSTIPPEWGPNGIRAIPMDDAVHRAAKSVARGANRIAQASPAVVLMAVTQALDNVDRTRPNIAAAEAVFALLVFLNGASPQPVALEDVAALLGWSMALPARAKGTSDSQPIGRKRQGDGKQQREIGAVRVIDRVVGHAGKDEAPYIVRMDSGCVWLASSAGPTAVFSIDPVESRGETVTPVAVVTEVEPRRRLTDRQLSTALSELNRKDGVNSVAWEDSKVALRIAMASYPRVNGWLPVFLGVGMMASAMGALHLPNELRGNPVAGPDGVRRRPAHLVADYGGWEVADEDQEEFALPLKSEIRSTLRQLPFESDTKMQGEEIVIRLPGPNGRLEGWLGRRRGRTDDHEMVVSKVTRPPWGAGVKFVLRVPCPGPAERNALLAMRANSEEWALVPSVNVWGGWSGEADSLRLTMFLPQMLFKGSSESKLLSILNFAMYGVNRANVIALCFGLA